MHTAGFWHEQARADSDNYVQIHWENIRENMKSQFQKENLKDMSHLGAKYDTCSIMHYGSKYFTKVSQFRSYY